MVANTMNQSAAITQNFWTIVSDKQYYIQIPRIQRDYAQGREDAETKQIRQALLKDIFRSLINNEAMDFNFIYGNVNTDESGKKVFVPIDGQQRLTTLFLLHWYFASWSGKLQNDTVESLGRFQYDTRFVAGSFCDKLVNDVRVDLRGLVETKQSLIEAIKDYYWFFSSYERDATIQGMLVMLQSIHDKVCELSDKSSADMFFDRLTAKDCPITFLFLDIEDLGLTDEIYIKMNARGKALTRFENFKAQLSGYLSEADENFSREFLNNVNGRWSSFFWHEEYRADVIENGIRQKSKLFDAQILNLFRFFMFNEYATRVDMSDASSQTKYLARDILGSLSKESDYEFVSHLFTDEYRTIVGHSTKEANVDSETFRLLNVLINVLAKKKEDTGNLKFLDDTLYQKQYFDEENCFRRLIRATDEKPLNYEEQLLVYAEYIFLINYAKPDYSFDKTKELTQWMRFAFNVVSNMNYSNVDDYMRALVRIRKIVDEGHAINILPYASRILRREYGVTSGFGIAEIAMKEECIKATLMLGSKRWNQSIIRAEKSFLGSQLSALLSFSDIWQMYEVAMSVYEKTYPSAERIDDNYVMLGDAINNESYIQRFDTYLNKINMIFSEHDLKPEMEENSILRRALLTFGGGDSYMLPAGKPVKCFLDAADRENSFKRLFRDENRKNKSDPIGVRVYFKQLLDSIDENMEVVPQLNTIISNMTYDDDSRWKKYFIEMPELLNSLYRKGGPLLESEAVFKNTKRFISIRNADQILLLEKAKTSSLNREYYSYVLYRRALKDGVAIEYNKNVSEDSLKFAYYTDCAGKLVKVKYGLLAEADRYQFIATNNDIVLYSTDSMDKMLSFIEGKPELPDPNENAEIVEGEENQKRETERDEEYQVVEDEVISVNEEIAIDTQTEETQEVGSEVSSTSISEDNYKLLSIADAFSENTFHLFVKYCDEHNWIKVGDLSGFDFEQLSSVKGIGKNKIGTIIKRYFELSNQMLAVDAHSTIEDTLFSDLHQDIATASVNILAGIGIKSKSIDKLLAANYQTMESLASISTDSLRKMITAKDISILQEKKDIWRLSIEEIIGIRLQELATEPGFKIVLAKEKGHTLQEIGDWNNVTRERIRQVIRQFNAGITPLMVELQNKLMANRSYFYEDEYLYLFDDRESYQVVSQWFKNSKILEHLDFAGVFIRNFENKSSYEDNILTLVTEFIGESLCMSEHLDEYDDLMKENGYPFMNEVALLNLAQKSGYRIYRDYIYKGKPSYALLCSKIVEKYFPDGIKLYEGSEDLPVVRKYAYREFGDIGIPEDDRAFSARLADYLILSGKGRCTAEANIHIEMRLLEKVKEYIDLNPHKEVAYSEVYSTFEEELAQYSNINNQYFLHGVLKLYYSAEYNFDNKDHLTKTGSNFLSSKFNERLLNFIITQRKPVTKNEIKAQFPGVSDCVILNAVSSDEELMQWEYNKYYAMACLLITEEDKAYLHESLLGIINQNNGYCSDNLLYDTVCGGKKDFLDLNLIHDANNLFYICMKLFQNEFDFRRPHITKKDILQNLSVKDVALHMMGYPVQVRYSDYQAIAEKLHWSGSTISMVFSVMEQDLLRVSDDLYIKTDTVLMTTSSVELVEQVLRSKMDLGYVALHGFSDWDELPQIQFAWNEFLLRSVVDKYIPALKIIEIRSTDRRYEKGLVVDEKSSFVEYSDLVVSVLRKQKYHEIAEEKLLNFLLDFQLTNKVIPKELYSTEQLAYSDGIFKVL